VGKENDVIISDCAEVRLAPDEQVTFFTPEGRQHDFAAKDWGFFLPSITGRLKAEGFKTALVSHALKRLYVLVVDRERMGEFEAYLAAHDMEVVEWLDERPL